MDWLFENPIQIPIKWFGFNIHIHLGKSGLAFFEIGLKWF